VGVDGHAVRQVPDVVTEQALAELNAMSAATVDRHLKPARDRMRIKGISPAKPSPLLRTSITIHTCADERPDRPAAIEADAVAHCGPTLISEFARYGHRWADHLRAAPTQIPRPASAALRHPHDRVNVLVVIHENGDDIALPQTGATEVMRQPISLASNSPNVTTVPAGC
jgi:hypothetical protein